MKSLPLQSNHQSLARHDDRAPAMRSHFAQIEPHFQPAARAVPPARSFSGKNLRPDLRNFREISSDFMAAETNREYFAEAAVFALVAGLAAWPVISMLTALAQIARG